jgi:hypothetical protein
MSFFVIKLRIWHIHIVVFDTWTNKKFRDQPRRFVTWTINETEQRPAIAITKYPTPCQLTQTPTPWPVSYDCRIEVNVRGVAIDIVWSIEGYLQHLQSDQEARERFAKCMKDYFPSDQCR